LVPGLATGIGSLPFADPILAAEHALTATPRLPCAPQLPNHDPRELMIPQWLGALPEVAVAPDGSISLRDDVRTYDGDPRTEFTPEAHSGLLAFLDVAGARADELPRVKVQCTGPLTLGLALVDAGMAPADAFRRAGEVVRAWLPRTSLILFFDEPGLVAWSGNDAPLEHEAAVDLLSGSLAAVTATTGVHVCGDGALPIALEAGPTIVGVEVSEHTVAGAGPLVRHLDAGGWIAWGAVPTGRPIGESVEPLWKNLASVWCEFAKRGADPVAIRSRAIITPACGLARHGVSQAEHALLLAGEIAARVHDQSIAARLTLGA
jgi:hypothetical protein